MKILGLPAAGLAITLGLAVIGCGGSGGSADTSAPTLDLTADQTAMTAVETTLTTAQNQGLSLADQAAAVLASMQKPSSGFTACGIASDNSVWGQCNDGLIYIVCTNDADLDGISLASPAARSARTIPPARPAVLVPAPGSLPGSAEAYVFNAMEANRLVPDADLTAQLISAGYNVVHATGSLADWKGVTGAGLLVCAAHGAPVPLAAGTTYYLETSDVFSGNNDAAKKVFQDSHGKVAIMTVEVLDDVLNPSGENTIHHERHYAFSSGFLTASAGPAMFTGNSLMFMHACSSMSPCGSAFATALGEGCGLSLYAGWSLPAATADDNETASFFFDRALGLNQFAPIDPTSPPPGDWAAILATMGSTSRASGRPYSLAKSLFQGQTSTFSFQPNNPANLSLTTLIPSISGSSYDAVTDLVTLTGSFGPDQGIVTLSGSYLTVESWDKGTITVDRPDQQSGGILVTSPLGLKSNLLAYNGPAPDAVWKGTSYAVTNASSFPIYDTSQIVLNEFQVDATHVYYRGTSSDSHGASYVLTCGSASAPATVTSNGDGTDSIALPATAMVCTTSPFCSTTIPAMTVIRTPTQMRYPGATYTWSSACNDATTQASAFTLTRQ